ncbi:MAG: two-component sensor histidine kinase, partial [Muribaculaceae bacterium]|nr:two-component sensor histidine kinase [Muribaculaceae bacterium]
MKKSTIWILIVVVALTFVSLLFMQVGYLKNMIQMRNDQFEEGVKRSIYSVSTKLEQDETRYFLEEDISTFESSLSSGYPTSATRTISIMPGFTSSPDSLEFSVKSQKDINILPELPKVELVDPQYKSMQEILKSQYLYQKNLLNEVILNILNESSDRSIEERADSTTIRSYLRDELENNGLTLPFEFAVVTHS